MLVLSDTIELMCHCQSLSVCTLLCLLFFSWQELMWFYQEGASFLFPDKWEDYLEPIPKVEREDLMSAYYKALTSIIFLLLYSLYTQAYW